MSEGLIKLQLALSQGPQFSVTSANEDEKDQKGIQGKEELITEETQPFFETNLQKVKTGLTRLKEQLNDLLAKDELVREEQQQIADLQNRLTNMREKSNEFHGQDEILRQEQQRVSVLLNQLEIKKRELTTLRKTELDESMEYETLLRVERQRRNDFKLS